MAGLLGPCVALAATADATGAPSARVIRIAIKDQSLATALLDVAQQSGIELILAAPSARTLMAPKIRGRYGLDEALTLLLSGSGLTWHRSADGPYVVSTLARAPMESDAPALPDILVIGKRTQNTDIRRGENNIQPYKVWTSTDVAQSHSANIDDFLRSRVSSNAQIGSALQMANGDTASRVNLRGLGASQTLVLVDGRRLPGLASSDIDIGQPDLNGIPLSAIERIEALDSTAGGIYGPGATAGVINVVLKHDYHGAEVGLTSGLSARGDAATKRLDARVGFSSESGRTQVTIAGSRTWGTDLRLGDRDFTPRARRALQRLAPAAFYGAVPASRSVNIVSSSGDALQLDQTYGGASLGSRSTSVPTGYAGVATDAGALFRANAGTVDTALSPDAAGAQRSLLTRPRLASLLANARHSFGDGVEAYADLLMVENAGQAIVPNEARVFGIAADAPTNPFQQDIVVSVPLPGYGGRIRSRNRIARLTGGLILDLPHAWKANLDYSVARATNRSSNAGLSLTPYLATASLASSINPLAGQAALLASVAPFDQRYEIRSSRRTNFSDLTVRLAGPITELGGGPLTLSVLAEDRYDHVPASAVRDSTYGVQLSPAFGVRVRSAYAEMRAPIFDRHAGPAGLRGLELQLALRYDANRSSLPADDPSSTGPMQTSTDGAMAYTIGVRLFPVEGVMVRLSSATGFLPPTVGNLGSLTHYYTSSTTLLRQADATLVPVLSPGPTDPLRGGSAVGSEAVYALVSGGSTHLRPERAQSLSAGIVLTPRALPDLRLSVDYTRIDKRLEIANLHNGDPDYFLVHERQFPTRVIRAPLTDADRAKGYTGGIVTVIDATSLNVGRTLIEALDVQLDYRIPTETIGDFRVHAAGTWQPRLTRTADLESASVNAVGYADGPLRWRGNGGIDWQRGPFMLGVAASYYHRYRVAYSFDSAGVAAQSAMRQGTTRIPAQTYVDVFASRRFALSHAPAGLESLDIRLGIENVFDHKPPLVVDPNTANYSLYGDPRLRRFELSILGRF